ncbi:cysteine-rich venom protein DIS2 [Pogona vitticeps]
MASLASSRQSRCRSRRQRRAPPAEMLLPAVILSLAALVKPSLGEEYPGRLANIPDTMKEEILNKLNAIRRGVQPPASNMLKLVWSENAAANARNWARKCRGTASPKAERIVDGALCGDSRLQTTFPMSWSDIVDVWNRKASNFKYGIGAIDRRKDIYTYTQMIWHNSFKVGCTMSFCRENEYNFLYVCRFCPAGNYEDEIPTPYKEGPPCGDCPNSCENNLCVHTCDYVDSSAYCETMLTMYTCESQFLQEMCAATCKCPRGST